MASGSVLVLLLVCVYTAAEDSLNITCEDVTGHVGDKLTLTCRVSYKDTNCKKMYKFIKKDKDREICRDNFTKDSCVQLTSISCPYTANEVMKTTFKVFIQTPHGHQTKEFTVNISGASKVEQLQDETVSPEYNPWKTDNAVLVVTGLVICLVIVVALGLILRKYNCTNYLKRGYDLGKREENNINEPENTEEV